MFSSINFFLVFKIIIDLKGLDFDFISFPKEIEFIASI